MIDRESLAQHYHKKKYVIVPAIVLCLILALLPMFFRQPFLALRLNHSNFFKSLLVLLPIAILYFCYTVKVGLVPRARIILLLFITGLSLLLVDIHSVYIDGTGYMEGTASHSSQYFGDMTNAQWQFALHDSVINLEKEVLPHSYRFLPNYLLHYFMILTDDFQFSTYLFRLIFMICLLYSIYYYGLLFFSHKTSLLAVLIYAVAYQISIRFYAGQIIDPVSHLCFVLSFIFLELDMFLYFALVVVVGCLAKESIAVMAVYYVIGSIWHRRTVLKACLLVALCVAVIAAIRLSVSHGIRYENISNVGLDHIRYNIGQINPWVRQVLFTVGIFIPFVVLSFKETVRPLRNLIIFLLPVLAISNLQFSWLGETRNLIPVLIPMAMVTANTILSLENNPQKPLAPTCQD